MGLGVGVVFSTVFVEVAEGSMSVFSSGMCEGLSSVVSLYLPIFEFRRSLNNLFILSQLYFGSSSLNLTLVSF